MTTYCQVTGARPIFGKSVSHSHKRTSRRWNPNLQRKRYWVPSLGRAIRLTVSAKGIRIIVECWMFFGLCVFCVSCCDFAAQ